MATIGKGRHQSSDRLRQLPLAGNRYQADRQAAPRRGAHAVGLAGCRPGAGGQSGACSTQPEICRAPRQDPGIKRGTGAPADRESRHLDGGLRDRALIGVMTYTFARIGAVVAMRVDDYYPNGKRWWVRLHEKGGKRHEMPAHHKLEAFIDEYLAAAGIRDDGKGPLFRTARGRTGALTGEPMHRIDAYRMIRRRAAEAGFKQKLGCHVFRATGITAYLEAGGTLENVQAMAAHESPRTTKLYDRTGDEITLDEVERITI